MHCNEELSQFKYSKTSDKVHFLRDMRTCCRPRRKFQLLLHSHCHIICTNDDTTISVSYLNVIQDLSCYFDVLYVVKFIIVLFAIECQCSVIVTVSIQ